MKSLQTLEERVETLEKLCFYQQFIIETLMIKTQNLSPNFEEKMKFLLKIHPTANLKEMADALESIYNRT